MEHVNKLTGQDITELMNEDIDNAINILLLAGPDGYNGNYFRTMSFLKSIKKNKEDM